MNLSTHSNERKLATQNNDSAPETPNLEGQGETDRPHSKFGGRSWSVKRAEQRRRATQNNDSAERLNLDEQDKGRTDEKVAEKVGVSKDTYRNGKRVKEIATGERDAPEEVVEVAQERLKKAGEVGGSKGTPNLDDP
jgi:hypothetical protein